MPLQRPLSILDRLIAFPSVSRESNLDIVGYIQELLVEAGIEFTLVHSEDGRKANLHAVIGPREKPGVMLSGHTDVVPVEGQAWTSDPFRMVQSDGRLFGRGTADMKGFLACMLTIAEEASQRALARPLHLAFSYDEEVGCVGVRRLIDRWPTDVLPAMCIVGEPTSMRTIIAHKGKIAARITCTGHECHSSHAPEGLNAIHLAAEMIGTLRALQDELAAGGRDEGFEIPFTTVHVGTIQGGTALNIVPKTCVLNFEIRNVPGDDPQSLLDRLLGRAEELTREAQTRFPDSGVTIDITNSYPGLDMDAGSDVVALIGRLTGANGAGKIDFGTEGGLFKERLGIPTVICGPGDIQQAHKPDEFIALDQLAQCMKMLRGLIDEMAA